MGGCRCSYKNCTNTTKTSENIHFFHYPVKHRERCIHWIENACKPNFYDLEEDQLRNKVVCEMHFENKWFPNSQKKRLLQGAIPTLDGECNNDEPCIPKVDSPVYLPSNQYNDVKVLPANDEGTVFVLDTENMYTRSHKIESYVIKNGVLVPSNSAPKPVRSALSKSNNSKPSTSNAFGGYYSAAEMEFAHVNTPQIPSLPEREQGFQQVMVKREVPEAPNGQERTENQFLVYENDEHEQHFKTSHSSETDEQKPSPLVHQPQTCASGGQMPLKNVVNKSYLRKIKQHSRDIATIKRMLKQKRIIQQKPDAKTILNVLQEQIPHSLLTIVSLLLGEKNELNEDDIEFFTTLHRSSPEVYQLLSDKYKWNLPSVDIVDSPCE